MSKPAIVPETTVAGISVDPRTLERVIPESRRPDGSVRKQLKIRPGFTPQEDVRRFRGSRQAQMDTNALPKGHIIGWTPQPTVSKPAASSAASKSAKKNEKRKEKRKEKREETKVKDNWEDDDDDEGGETQKAADNKENKNAPLPDAKEKAQAGDASTDSGDVAEALADKLGKLEVR